MSCPLKPRKPTVEGGRRRKAPHSGNPGRPRLLPPGGQVIVTQILWTRGTPAGEPGRGHPGRWIRAGGTPGDGGRARTRGSRETETHAPHPGPPPNQVRPLPALGTGVLERGSPAGRPRRGRIREGRRRRGRGPRSSRGAPGRPLPPTAALRCGAHGLRRLLFRLAATAAGRTGSCAPPAPFPRLLLTLTSDQGAGGTLRSRPGGSRGPGLRGTCPPGPGRGRAGRAAGCRGRFPAAGAVGGASLGLPALPSARRVTDRSPPPAPHPRAGAATSPFPFPASALGPGKVWVRASRARARAGAAGGTRSGLRPRLRAPRQIGRAHV